MTMQRFRRLGFLVVLFSLVSVLLAACGDPTATTAPAATTTAAATTAAATTTARPATTAAATTTVAGTTAAATTAAATTTAGAATTAAGAKKLKVGLVTDIGRINDKSFNQSAWEGVLRAQKELGAEVKYIETTDTKDYAKNIKSFTDEKFDVIVTVGFLMFDATVEAAKTYPNIYFIGVDQFHDGKLPNLTGLVFDEDKAGFLIGALAAGMSKSGKIGAVLGTKSVPAVFKFGEGYKNGAEYLFASKPDLVPAKKKPEVVLTYHPDGDNAFTNPVWGAQQAQALVAAGNDVIFGGGGNTGNGAVEGAAEKGVYVIGVDADQYLTLPKAASRMLSSAMKLITPGVFDLVKNVQDGTFKPGNFVGQVGLAPFHDMDKEVPQALKDQLTAIDKGLRDGSIKTGVKLS
jgi:basic membrane protein A